MIYYEVSRPLQLYGRVLPYHWHEATIATALEASVHLAGLVAGELWLTSIFLGILLPQLQPVRPQLPHIPSISQFVESHPKKHRQVSRR